MDLEQIFIVGLLMATVAVPGAYLYGVYGGIAGVMLGAAIGLAILSFLLKRKK